MSVSNILGVETEEGKKVYYNLPVEYITSAYGEGILVRDNEQEISLEDEEKLIEEGKEFVRWIGDWEKVELTSKYSFSYKQMEKTAGINGTGNREWRIAKASEDSEI